MDNYEKLLEEKIENAKKKQNPYFKTYDDYLTLSKLYGEIEAYQDALNEYRQLKMKEALQ